MSSCLHLHLGVHKTATTHFQQALIDVSDRAPVEYTVVSNQRFRAKVTHANRFLDSRNSSELHNYLRDLLSVESKVLVLSEENLIGEAKDFVNACMLYEKAEMRLVAFSSLLPKDINIKVWLFIRSLDSFLPAIYCEYLRHWPYVPFERVLGGVYKHSWVPLIQTIRSIMPGAEINVLNYDSYQTLAPKMLSAMTGIRLHSLSMDTRVIRPRLTDSAVQLSKCLPGRLPSSWRIRMLEWTSSISRRSGASSGFASLSQVVAEELRSVFQEDLEEIRSIREVSLFE